MLDPNPYAAPHGDPAPPTRAPLRWKRPLAFALMLTPLIVLLPLRYWAFQWAGGWLVATDLPPAQRIVYLGMAYTVMMFCVAVFSLFPAFLLLWSDRCRPWLMGTLTIICGLLLIPATFLAWTFIDSYLRFG